MARDEGVLVSINTDAHSVLEFDNLKYGIGQARRGWLSMDDVLNTRPLSELKRLFGQRPVVKSGAARAAAH
jgi:DNA polymerase (family X)